MAFLQLDRFVYFYVYPMHPRFNHTFSDDSHAYMLALILYDEHIMICLHNSISRILHLFVILSLSLDFA